MDKMTAQEFKKVLTDAGLPFDTYGYEGILNELSLGVRLLSFEALARGAKNTADWYMSINDALFRALDDRGYYNEQEDE